MAGNGYRASRRRGRRERRRVWAVWAPILIVAVFVALAFASAPRSAQGKSGETPAMVTIAASDLHGSKAHGSTEMGYQLHWHAMSSTAGDILYCADSQNSAPSVGETLTGAQQGGLVLDYILYYGYGGEGYTNVSSLTGDDARAATQRAVWLALADAGQSQSSGAVDFTGGQSAEAQSVYQAAKLLLSDAKSNAKAGEVYAGTSWIYSPASGGTQRVIGQVVAGGRLVRLHKTSSLAGVTAGNPCYSLNGATYQLIASDGSVVATLTCDAQGDTDTVRVTPGTYTLHETKTGIGYALSADKRVSVSAGSGIYVVTVSDAPLYDLVDVVVGKVDADGTSTSANLPQGAASLEGAEFEVEYYATLDYSTLAKLKASGIAPQRTWLVRTGADGFARLQNGSLASGSDALWLGEDGRALMPRGTVVIRETKAPAGYLLNEGWSSFQIIDPTTSASATAYSAPMAPDSVQRGGVSIQKLDSQTAATAQGDGSFAGIRFQVINANDQAVWSGGSWHGSGAVVCVIETDATGAAATATDALPYGTYRVHEVTDHVAEFGRRYGMASDWYRADASDQTVTIASQGQLVELEFQNAPATELVRITKTDAQTGSFPQGGASLSGIAFEVVNENSAPVWYGARAYAAGEVVTTLVTGSDGSTPSAELPLGTYRVREVDAGDGYATNGSYRADASEATVVLREPGKEVGVEMSDHVVRGGVSVQKLDWKTGATPQGDASLGGITFEVVNESENPVVVGGRTYQSGEVVLTLVTDPNGTVSSSATALPYGTYAVREAATNSSMRLTDGSAYYFDVTSQGRTYDPSPWSSEPHGTDRPLQARAGVTDQPRYGSITVTKLDAVTGSTPQGDASLAGITFTVYNQSANPVVAPDGTTVPVGGAVMSIVTGEDGVATTGEDALPYGTYLVRETSTNASMLNSSSDTVVVIGRDGDHDVHTIEAADEVVRGGVRVEKRDLETGLSAPLGGASLDGTTFEVVNRSAKPVWVGGALRQPGEVVLTLTAQDGTASSDDRALPYGNYSVREVSASEGYLLSDQTEYAFRVAEDGHVYGPGEWYAYGSVDESVVPLADAKASDPAVRDQVMRMDLELEKKAGGQTHMGLVAFAVTSKTTGETHVVVTDENGYASTETSWNAHTHSTNANDWALSEEGTIDSSMLDPTSGIWFGLAADGFVAPANDALCALPYDEYEIRELRCTANEGLSLITDSFAVSRDSRVVRLGTLDDESLPGVTTYAYDPTDGDHRVLAGQTELVDEVGWWGLQAGKAYRIETTLVYADTGEAVGGASTTTTVKAAGSSGTRVIAVAADTDALTGRTVAFCERIYDASDTLVAEHADKDDIDQQIEVLVPSIGTMAADGEDGDGLVVADPEATVVDTVSYENLLPGREYLLSGTLYNKATGKPLEAGGRVVTASASLTPESSSGTSEVAFSFDASSLPEGSELVAVETLSYDGDVVASHKDLADEGQTVTIARPSIATMARDGFDGDNTVFGDSESTVIDTVSYRNLVPGKRYVVNGMLYDKSTGEPLEADGKDVTASVAFMPETPSGSVEVAFAFDARALPDGAELVVFESLLREGTEVAAHADSDDTAQAVTVVQSSVRTTASDAADGDKRIVADPEACVVDTVDYENLLPGHAYVLNGELMDKSTGERLSIDDEAVGTSVSFSPESSSGSVELTFTFDASQLSEGTKLVAFETLSRLAGEGEGAEHMVIATHKDLDDEGQTVTIVRPSIGTIATDSLDEDHQVFGDPEARVTDTIAYENLVPGKEYVVSGTLYDKSTSEPLEVDGKRVSASAALIPEEPSGSVEVTFAFDATVVSDGTQLVAFESLSRNGVELATHADIDDEAQAVLVLQPLMATSACDVEDGDKELARDARTTIRDAVRYERLLPGQSYVITATIYDKADGLLVGGATSSRLFVPGDASGSVEVDVAVPTKGLDGHELVVFEDLYRLVDGEQVLVTRHADADDADQSVRVAEKPPAIEVRIPFTGEQALSVLPLACGAAIVALALVLRLRGVRIK